MNDSDSNGGAGRKRPSARRAGADAVSPAQQSAATEAAGVGKPAPAAPATASHERRRTGARAARAAAPSAAAMAAEAAAGDAAASDAAQAELRDMERSIDALLGDVRHVDGDEEARKRAADAIAHIATRLAAGRDPEPGHEHAVGQKARQYLSPDFYLQRLAERGMRHRSDRVDDFGYDPSYDARVRPFFELMSSKYFRTQVDGIEHVPSSGRVLLVCNHSGSLPWDGVMLRTALQLHHPARRELRWLVEDFVFHAPFLGAFINRIGAVRACQENAERLLRDEQLLAVFPEGQKGIEKGYTHRYKLQRFGRGGYIKLALRTGTPIVPVAVVGAEETYPLLYKVKAFSKALGMPYIPVTPTFPWLGPLGAAPLPSRWRIAFGKPVTELSKHGPDAANDDILVGELNERVRTDVQRLVDDARALRGKRAYL